MRKNDNLIYSSASPEQVAKDLEPLVHFSDHGLSLESLSAMISERLIPHFVKYDRPEFHSLYNFLPEEGAEFGAKIALHHNQGVTNWRVSPGAVMLEELCGRALCRLFGLSPNADATFMYSGTYANQQALYMALHKNAEDRGFSLADTGLSGFEDSRKLAVIVSEEAHLSLRHAVRMLGLGEQSLVAVPVDKDFRMDLDSLRKTVDEIREKRIVFCIVSTAGTTSTGSIDPIEPVQEICRDIGAWHHVDGAYGLAFSLLPELEPFFKGLEKADSVCWDPHKQFGVPIPNSLLFVGKAKEFQRMAVYGHYFNREGDPEPNPGLKSPPTTRPFSALPLVTTIRYQGLDKIRESLRSPVKAVRDVYEALENREDVEIFHAPQTGLLCLRIAPRGISEDRLDQLQAHLYESIKKEGRRSISMTRLRNKAVLRLVAISPSVTAQSMLATIDVARDLAGEY